MNIISKSRLILAFLLLLSGVGVAESSSYSDGDLARKTTIGSTEISQQLSKERELLLNEADERSVLITGLDSDNETKTVSRTRNIPLPAAILLFGPTVLCLLGLSGKRK